MEKNWWASGSEDVGPETAGAAPLLLWYLPFYLALAAALALEFAAPGGAPFWLQWLVALAMAPATLFALRRAWDPRAGPAGGGAAERWCGAALSVVLQAGLAAAPLRPGPFVADLCDTYYACLPLFAAYLALVGRRSARGRAPARGRGAGVRPPEQDGGSWWRDHLPRR